MAMRRWLTRLHPGSDVQAVRRMQVIDLKPSGQAG